jgi:exopolysaccharide biosynthesis polyprenyl glycosylphosphotransferase
MRLDASRRLTLEQGVLFFVSAGVLVLSARGLARRIARLSIPPQRVLFVGGGLMAGVLAAKIRQHPEYRLQPIGYVDAAESQTLRHEMPYLGHVSEVQDVALRYGVDRLVVASPSAEEDEVEEIVRTARGLDISISILPQMVDVLGPAVEIDDVEGVTVLGLNPPALTPSSRALKRAMDLALAAPALVLFSPLMVLSALAVKLDSRGPVFFSQERIGRHGLRFRIHKFRTMVADADARTEELRNQSDHPVWLLLDRDPRVTRVGRVLRHTSLDELPQLWNVVRGHMSLVGPRPMPPDVDEHISGWGRTRLDLTPGVTGLWQVLGRTAIPFEEMVKLDYLYVTNWSLWQDVRLLIHTLPAVANRRGVN